MKEFEVKVDCTTENRNGLADIVGVVITRPEQTGQVVIQGKRKNGKYLRGATVMDVAGFEEICKAGIVNLSVLAHVLVVQHADDQTPHCYAGWAVETVYQAALDDLVAGYPDEVNELLEKNTGEGEQSIRKVVDDFFEIYGNAFLCTVPIQ